MIISRGKKIKFTTTIENNFYIKSHAKVLDKYESNKI